MPNFLLVMIGGAVGAGLRYEVGRVALRQMGPGFPWGTLVVNLVGGLLIGVLAGALAAQGSASRTLWMLLAVGLLGGFTTFSAFSFDLFAMLERGQFGMAMAYALGSVAGSLLLLFAGWELARLTA
jgi:fluoride exporter